MLDQPGLLEPPEPQETLDQPARLGQLVLKASKELQVRQVILALLVLLVPLAMLALLVLQALLEQLAIQDQLDLQDRQDLLEI